MDTRSIEEMWAERLLARETRLVCAESAPCALALLGLVQPRDRVVMYASVAQSGADEGLDFACGVVSVGEPTAEAFLTASGDAHPSYEAEGSRLWWFVELLGGTGLRVPDLRALGKVARERGALLVVDNTAATCFGCNPLRLGAVLAFEGLDRFRDVHTPRSLAAISIARSQLKRHQVDKAAQCAHALLEGYSLPALDLPDGEAEALGRAFSEDASHMQPRFDHARAFAEYAAANEMIRNVEYPGLSGHRDHSVATGVLEHGFGPRVCIELAGSDAALRLFRELGGTKTEPLHLSDGATVSAGLGEDGRFWLFDMGEGNVFELIDRVDSALRKVCIR